MWRPGDRVMGIDAGGGYASRVATHERQLLAVPAGIMQADIGLNRILLGDRVERRGGQRGQGDRERLYRARFAVEGGVAHGEGAEGEKTLTLPLCR